MAVLIYFGLMLGVVAFGFLIIGLTFRQWLIDRKNRLKPQIKTTSGEA